MKIVFIGCKDIRMLGGIENYMYNLAGELVKEGHTPIVYCESNRDGAEIINGFEVRFVRGPKSYLLCKPWVGLKATLRTVLKEKDTDIIHYNAWPPSLWSWIPTLAGIPSLMEGHGLEWQRSKYRPGERKLLKLMERITTRMNRNLVMCSRDQVKYFNETYGRQAVCIPGGTNLPSKTPDTAEKATSSRLLARLGISAGRYFLFMGRLVQDKNPDFLIRAFEQAGLDGYKLVIAGNNDAMPEYVSYLHNISSSPDVVFAGAVYGEEKTSLLRNAYAFCLPSTVEGLSIALMEAMSYRLPIIASDIQANRELLGSDALFVKIEDEDSLCSALKQSVSFPSFGEFTEANYRKIEAEYTWQAITRRYIEYILSIRWIK